MKPSNNGGDLWIEYNLHKDNSWIAESCKDEAERQARVSELRRLGYNPRCTRTGK
jgi:hypothetical protein